MPPSTQDVLMSRPYIDGVWLDKSFVFPCASLVTSFYTCFSWRISLQSVWKWAICQSSMLRTTLTTCWHPNRMYFDLTRRYAFIDTTVLDIPWLSQTCFNSGRLHSIVKSVVMLPPDRWQWSFLSSRLYRKIVLVCRRRPNPARCPTSRRVGPTRQAAPM